ncbi:cyclic lactone autoinducer peptide [Listeria cornellensis]
MSSRILTQTERRAIEIADRSTKSACSFFVYEPKIPNALLNKIKQS